MAGAAAAARCGDPIVIAVAVEKRRGAFQLRAAFEALEDNDAIVLFGPSGCGKSTLVQIIAGLLTPDRGRIVIGDRTVFDSALGIDVAPERRRLGCVFQEGLLFPHLSVYRNLLYGAERTTTAEMGFDAVIALLALKPLLERKPGALSSGERQRVAIGRALLSGPQLLLMDEPLAALDAARKAEIMPFLNRLRDDLHITMIYVTHALDEALQLGDRVVLLDAGSVVADGTPESVFNRHAPSLDGTTEAGAVVAATVAAHAPAWGSTRLRLGRGEVSLPLLACSIGTRVRLHIRARDVILALDDPSRISARSRLPGYIAAIRDIDAAHALVTVGTEAGPLQAMLTRQSVHDLALTPGTMVWALIKAAALDPAYVGPMRH